MGRAPTELEIRLTSSVQSWLLSLHLQARTGPISKVSLARRITSIRQAVLSSRLSGWRADVAMLLPRHRRSSVDGTSASYQHLVRTVLGNDQSTCPAGAGLPSSSTSIDR